MRPAGVFLLFSCQTSEMMVPGRNNRGILFFMGHKSGNFDVFFKIFVKK